MYFERLHLDDNYSSDDDGECLAVWHSGSVVGHVNEVTLRQAKLLLGWVIDFGRVDHLGI